MKQFLEYLLERKEIVDEYHFQARDFSHREQWDYLTAVLSTILSGGTLSIGKDGTDGEVDFSDKKYKVIVDELSANVDFSKKPPIESLKKFNEIVSKAGIKWQTIWKFPFSHATNRTEDEIATVNSLSAQLSAGPLLVKCMGDIYNIASVEKVSGTPKADIVLKDEDGNGCIWVSLKKGTSIKDFGGYGGISEKYLNVAEKQGAINKRDREAVSAFVEALSVVLNGEPIDKTYYSEQIPKNLQVAALYGYDYNKTEFGSHNCQYVAQGNVRLKKIGNAWQLTADHLLRHKKVPTDNDYKPIFAARKSNDRNSFGLNGVRVGIFPKGYVLKRTHEELSISF